MNIDKKIINLKNEISTLEDKISNGAYKKEELLLAKDMLKTKKDELNKLNNRKATPVLNAPIKGLQAKKHKTYANSGGGIVGH